MYWLVKPMLFSYYKYLQLASCVSCFGEISMTHPKKLHIAPAVNWDCWLVQLQISLHAKAAVRPILLYSNMLHLCGSSQYVFSYTYKIMLQEIGLFESLALELSLLHYSAMGVCVFMQRRLITGESFSYFSEINTTFLHLDWQIMCNVTFTEDPW